jgi:hypothetical protein
MYSMSLKQNLNTRSSTKAELVGVNDAMSMILWTCLCLQTGLRDGIQNGDRGQEIFPVFDPHCQQSQLHIVTIFSSNSWGKLYYKLLRIYVILVFQYRSIRKVAW